MATQKIFRETAFNGYNRDDVRDYILKQDEKIRQLETEVKERTDTENAELEELRAETNRLNGIISELNNDINIKNNENLDLSSQIMELNNTVLKKDTELREKTEETDALKKELSEYREKLSSMSADSEKKDQQITEQNERLSALGNQNEKIENDIRKYIEQAEKLRKEAEDDLLSDTKLHELQSAIAERDERIRFLEESWKQHKSDYGVYTEVKKNVEKIITEAKKKAETICANADTEAKKKVAAAEIERDRIMSQTKDRLSDLRLCAESIVTSIELASSEIAKKLPEPTEEKPCNAIPDDLLKLLKIGGESNE